MIIVHIKMKAWLKANGYMEVSTNGLEYCPSWIGMIMNRGRELKLQNDDLCLLISKCDGDLKVLTFIIDDMETSLRIIKSIEK